MSHDHAGEFARHWADHTAEYRWDGHDGGIDINVWAYAHPAQELPGFTIVAQQMPPSIVGAGNDAEPANWGMRIAVGADGAVLEWCYTAGVDEAGQAVASPLAPRVGFDTLPEHVQNLVWEAAAEGHRTAGGIELAYDRATGQWSTAGA